MKIIRDLSELDENQRSVVAIGNFDGVHSGHRVLVDRLVKTARQRNVPSIVFTFDPHPLQLLRPERLPPQLLTVNRKAELLSDCGVDLLVACPTTPALLQMTYMEFFHEVISKRLKAVAILEGPNFFFGKNREGTVQDLARPCDQTGVELEIVEIKEIDGETVSSSIIRKLIQNGEIETANRLLTVPYSVAGIVQVGSQRGHQLGFPTANLHDVKTLLPGEGVYAGYSVFENKRVRSAINVGPNPTFSDLNKKVEVHLLDENHDLYGKDLVIEFHFRIRGVRRFDSADDLTEQIKLDIRRIRELVA